MSRDEIQARSMSEAVTRYEGYLEMAAEFLTTKYGIDEETATRFRLGVVGDPMPGHGAYNLRMCLPYLDASGAPRALKFRCLHAHDCKPACVKYLCTEASEPRLFNVGSLCDDQATTLYVTEGEMDCIVLSQHGLAAIGYPGTGSWKPVFTRAIGPQDWERIVVVGDGDEAGRAAAKKVAKEVRGEVLELPLGDDASSLNVKGTLRSFLGLDEEDL